jgi:hypothetical protein
MRSLEPSLPSFPVQAFPHRILRWLGGRVDAGRFLKHRGKCAVAPPSQAARGVVDRQLNSGLQALVAIELRGLTRERRTVISKLRNIPRRRCAVSRVPVVVVVHVDNKRTGVSAPTSPRFLQPALSPAHGCLKQICALHPRPSHTRQTRTEQRLPQSAHLRSRGVG